MKFAKKVDLKYFLVNKCLSVVIILQHVGLSYYQAVYISLHKFYVNYTSVKLEAQYSENEDHGIQSHHFMGNRWGKQWKQCQTLFFWVPKSLQMVTSAMKLKDAYSLEEKL